MKILVLNGSPRGKKSTTMQITNSFLRGIKKTDDDIKVVHLVSYKIAPCKGCYCCWTYTPGKCVIKDDAVWILEDYLDADMVIWSSPLYSFGLTSIAKAMLDRLLPVYQPIIEERKNGQVTHPFRFDLNHQRYVLISGCGFYSYENNYEGLVKQFEIMYGDHLSSIICTEGELFKYEELKYRTSIYLELVEKAGHEYRANGVISEKTDQELKERHFIPSKYVSLANASWDITDRSLNQQEALQIKAKNKLIQMATTYDNTKIKDKLIILEFLFDDCGYQCQLVLNQTGCNMIENKEEFMEADVRFVTTVKKWTQVTERGLLRRRGERGDVRKQSGFQYLVDFVISLHDNHIRKEIKMI
jgi:hypothetical protein